MKIFVPNESAGGESRVALVPATVKRLIASGVEVSVETKAGALAGSGDKSSSFISMKIDSHLGRRPSGAAV